MKLKNTVLAETQRMTTKIPIKYWSCHADSGSPVPYTIPFISTLECLIFYINVFIIIGGYLLYNIVLVLPYINMNLPWVYMCFLSWTPVPPPSPYHPSGSSQCTSPKHPVMHQTWIGDWVHSQILRWAMWKIVSLGVAKQVWYCVGWSEIRTLQPNNTNDRPREHKGKGSQT